MRTAVIWAEVAADVKKVAVEYFKSNVIAATYWVVFAFLVAGQAIHISNTLSESYGNTVSYFDNQITYDGHVLSSYILLFIVKWEVGT